MPSGAATMQIMRMSRAPALRSRSSAATALPPVASIGSIISTKLPSSPLRQLRVVPARRRGRSRRAAGRCGRPARSGISSRTASSMPSPARSTGTTTTSAATRRPVGRAERRLRPVIGEARQVARRFGRQQQADADRHPAEQLRRRRRASRSVASASCTSGCSTRCSGTRSLYRMFRGDRREPLRRDCRGGTPLIESRLHDAVRCAAVAVVAARRRALVAQAAGTPRGLARRHQRHRGHDGRQSAACSARARWRSTAATSSRSTRPRRSPRGSAAARRSTPPARSSCPA